MFRRKKIGDFESDLRVKSRQWKDLYNTSFSPYDIHVLDQKGFLNPGNQNYLNFGYMEKENIENWLKDKYDSIVFKSKEHMEELYFLCKIPDMMFINMLFPEFVNIEVKYIAPNTYFDRNKNEKDDFIDIRKSNQEDILNVFLSFVKFNYKNSISIYKAGNAIEVYKSNDMHTEGWGVLRAAALMGIGYYGASNTPKEKYNLSWVQDIIYYEALLEVYIENKIITEEEVDKYIVNSVNSVNSVIRK